MPPGAELHVDLDGLGYIDHACLELLMNWAKQHEAGGGRVLLDWGAYALRTGETARAAAALIVQRLGANVKHEAGQAADRPDHCRYGRLPRLSMAASSRATSYSEGIC